MCDFPSRAADGSCTRSSRAAPRTPPLFHAAPAPPCSPFAFKVAGEHVWSRDFWVAPATAPHPKLLQLPTSTTAAGLELLQLVPSPAPAACLKLPKLVPSPAPAAHPQLCLSCALLVPCMLRTSRGEMQAFGEFIRLEREPWEEPKGLDKVLGRTRPTRLLPQAAAAARARAHACGNSGSSSGSSRGDSSCEDGEDGRGGRPKSKGRKGRGREASPPDALAGASSSAGAGGDFDLTDVRPHHNQQAFTNAHMRKYLQSYTCNVQTHAVDGSSQTHTSKHAHTMPAIG